MSACSHEEQAFYLHINNLHTNFLCTNRVSLCYSFQKVLGMNGRVIMERIEDCFGFLLGKAYQKVFQLEKARLSAYGVTAGAICPAARAMGEGWAKRGGIGQPAPSGWSDDYRPLGSAGADGLDRAQAVSDRPPDEFDLPDSAGERIGKAAQRNQRRGKPGGHVHFSGRRACDVEKHADQARIGERSVIHRPDARMAFTANGLTFGLP